ncbi:MAG: DNA cytosine methyltransferase [Bacteroidota bacterium]
MKAIEFYSGVGGFSLGAKRAGFDVTAAFELDWRHVETYNKNFASASAVVQDVSKIDFEKHDFGINLDDIDLVLGGPPCQGFSNGGKQIVNDERNNQIIKFAELIVQIQPSAFVMENVRGILNKKFRSVVNEFFRILSKENYTLYDPLLLNAKDFSVPQDRKRVFFIGIKKKAPKSITVRNINDTKGLKVNVGCALNDILNVNHEPNTSDIHEVNSSSGSSEYLLRLTRDDDDLITHQKLRPNYLTGFTTTLHSSTVIERFGNTKPGTAEPISRYKRLALDGLSPTLRAGTKRGKGQFMAPRPIHPIHNRCITTREAARLHSFPDWFQFYPTKWYGMMQIGNSVPPNLAESVSSEIYKIIS